MSDPDTVANVLGLRPEDFDTIPLGSAPEGMPIPQPGIRPKIEPRRERAHEAAPPPDPAAVNAAADELRAQYRAHVRRVTAMAATAKESGDAAREARAAAEVRATAELGERLKAKARRFTVSLDAELAKLTEIVGAVALPYKGKSVEVEGDGTLILKGTLATCGVDRQMEAFDEASLRTAFQKYFERHPMVVFNHRLNQSIGKLIAANFTRSGEIEVEAESLSRPKMTANSRGFTAP